MKVSVPCNGVVWKCAKKPLYEGLDAWMTLCTKSVQSVWWSWCYNLWTCRLNTLACDACSAQWYYHLPIKWPHPNSLALCLTLVSPLTCDNGLAAWNPSSHQLINNLPVMYVCLSLWLAVWAFWLLGLANYFCIHQWLLLTMLNLHFCPQWLL